MAANRSVILVHPSASAGWSAQPWCDLPLELITVGSPLVRLGYRVHIIDQRVQPDWRGRQRTGRSACLRGGDIDHRSAASSSARGFAPGQAARHVPVVWGGVHASLLPEQTLEKSEIDFVVQGEGERTLPELVAALEGGTAVRGIAGLWHKDSGRIVNGAPRPFIDLNEEPFLQYELVDMSKYTRTVFGVKRLSFSTSRGCSFLALSAVARRSTGGAGGRCGRTSPWNRWRSSAGATECAVCS